MFQLKPSSPYVGYHNLPKFSSGMCHLRKICTVIKFELVSACCRVFRYFNINRSVHRNNILIYIQQDAMLLHYNWKLFYMFQVVPPPIIRSTYSCIYNIWYSSCHYCYLPQHTQTSSNSSTIAAGSSNGMTNTRCCRYSCMCS
jgi:hypothetical protein